MNQEKFNLNKAKREAKKHEGKSTSFIGELKIDKTEKQEDLLPEELEARFWSNVYKEKLNEIKNDEDFKRIVIKDLEWDIKEGKNSNGGYADCALHAILSIKDLVIYEKEFQEKFNKVKNDKDFKKAVIKRLEESIELNAKWALYTISSLKNISEFWQDLAQEKRAKMARDNKEGGDIPKRPEIR